MSHQPYSMLRSAIDDARLQRRENEMWCRQDARGATDSVNVMQASRLPSSCFRCRQDARGTTDSIPCLSHRETIGAYQHPGIACHAPPGHRATPAPPFGCPTKSPYNARFGGFHPRGQTVPAAALLWPDDGRQKKQESLRDDNHDHRRFR